MSLILEALRKSEAERRRGEAPVLHVELPPGLEARMRRRWRPPVAVVVAAALLGAAGGVFWYQAPRAPDGAIPDRTPQDSALPQGGLPGSVATPAGGTPSGEAHAPSPAGTHPEPERYAAGLPAVERILPPPPAVDAGPAPAPPGDGSGHAGTGAVAPTATAQTGALAAAQAGHAAAAPTDGGPAASAATPGPIRAPAAPSTPSTPSAPPVPSAAAAADAVDRPAAPAPRTSGPVLRVSGLSSAQRQRLPPLKLSLHMWDEDPARRFAVVDGQRRVEGDRLGDAVITTIDREGLLLELDGRAVRIPLP